MFTWIFGSILVPTWLHFGSQNPPKSSQKSIPKGINFLIDFYIDFFLSIFDCFGRPTWGHVGHIFLQNGAVLWDAAPLFVGFMLFLAFLALLAPSWRHLGSILEGLGLHFGGFWDPFWRFLVTIGVPCGLVLFKAVFLKLPRRLGLGWWGYAKRKEFKRTQLPPIHHRTNQAPCGYASAYRI